MKTLAALLAWLCLVLIARGSSDALVLIQPGIAGISSPYAGYVSPQWVLWPYEASHEGHSALWSIVTGLDWRGDNEDGLYKRTRSGGFRAASGPDLERRGLLQARWRFLGDLKTYALAGAQDTYHETALMLATADAKAPVLELKAGEAWPNVGLVVHEASSWNDAVSVGLKSRRTLVIEYPPRTDQPWTRFWLFGGGWPKGVPQVPGLGVPGLVPARSMLSLLRTPSAFRWTPDDTATWGGADKWLNLVRVRTPLARTAFGFALGALICLGLGLTLRERRSLWLPDLFLVALLTPVASVLGGNLSHGVGIDALPIATFIVLLGLVALAKSGQKFASRRAPDAHGLLAPALLAWTALTFSNPLWSPLSGAFGSSQGFPAVAFGCWYASLVASFAFARNSHTALQWILRACVFLISASSMFVRFWWAPEPLPYALLPILGLMFGEGFWRWTLAPGLPILGALTTPGIMYGIAWKSGGLLSDGRDVLKLDASAYVSTLVSPLFVGAVAFVFCLSLVADRFLIHQFKRLVAIDSRRDATLLASAGLALVGLTQPILLPAALWVSVAGVTILLSDAVQVL